MQRTHDESSAVTVISQKGVLHPDDRKDLPSEAAVPCKLTNLASRDPHCTVCVLPFLGGLEVALPPTDTLKQLDCPGPTREFVRPSEESMCGFLFGNHQEFQNSGTLTQAWAPSGSGALCVCTPMRLAWASEPSV